MNTLASGLLHPLLVPAHAVALVGLGLLIGQRNRLLLPLLAFAAALAGALAAIGFGIGQTPAGNVVLVMAAVSGTLAAAALPLPMLVSAALSAIAGAAIGLDSPPQAITLAAASMMLVGTGLGACLALAIVTVAVANLTRDWQRIGARILGSWIAASAILVLAMSWR